MDPHLEVFLGPSKGNGKICIMSNEDAFIKAPSLSLKILKKVIARNVYGSFFQLNLNKLTDFRNTSGTNF